jgi:hypothetical protein
MSSLQNDKSKDGVSPAIKIFVIILTIVTVLAFIVLAFKLVSKITSSAIEKPWALELRVVGDKLKEAGLHRQAIAQYAKFIEYEDIDLKTRSKVSQTMGELYQTLGNCGSALVWFYKAEVAGPAPTDKTTLDFQIATCLAEVKSGQP